MICMTGRKNACKTKTNMYKNYTNYDSICRDPGVIFFFVVDIKDGWGDYYLKTYKEEEGLQKKKKKKKKKKRPTISHSCQEKYHVH